MLIPVFSSRKCISPCTACVAPARARNLVSVFAVSGWQLKRVEVHFIAPYNGLSLLQISNCVLFVYLVRDHLVEPSSWPTRTGRRTRRKELQPTLQMRLQLNLQHQIQSREPQRVLLTSSPGCARARAKTTRWPRKRRRLNLKILAWSVLLLMMISSIISSSCSVTQSCDVAVATLSTV